MQLNSFGEGCAYSLHQTPTDLGRLHQLAQGLNLDTGDRWRWWSGRSPRHAQSLRVETDLGNGTSYARIVLNGGTPQRFVVTVQVVELLSHSGLCRDPVTQKGFKTRYVQLGQ